MKNFVAVIIIILFAAFQINAQSIFVSTTGSDSNPGTIDFPLKSISLAISKISAGDTIFIRGGTYQISSTISITKIGTQSSMYYLFAYPGEYVLLDCSGENFGAKGISLNKAEYWYIKGLNVYHAGDNGMELTGASNNIIELCNFFENQDSGMQLGNGASYNKIINCDSYYNADPPDYGDADGFAPKLTVGTGNYFYGCRSWGNCDDGWDGYMRGATGVTTTLENCWTFENGYLKDGTDPGSQANGNGFKMGGGDNHNSEHLKHNFILKDCLSFHNKAKGFDQNNNYGSMTLYNCTGYGNKSANYRITLQVDSGQTVDIKNCVSLNGVVDLGSFVVQGNNSWMNPFIVTDDDFISIDTTGVRDPRKADGSLPDVDFMHLSKGSDLIDAGVDVGIPYSGSAPDLGAFEYGMSIPAGVKNGNEIPKGIRLYQNYPNPFNPATRIEFSVSKETTVKLEILNILGQKIATLVEGTKPAGNYSVDFNSSNLSSGIYIYRLYSAGQIISKKMLLVK